MSSLLGIVILIGIGIVIGYLLFGRKREKVVYVQNTPRSGVINNQDAYRISEGGLGSNLLGTAAAVAGGVIAGELIADAVEDMMHEDVGEEIQKGVNDAVDYIENAIKDTGDLVEDAIDDIEDDFSF